MDGLSFCGKVVVVIGAGGWLGKAHENLLAGWEVKLLINDPGGDFFGEVAFPAAGGIRIARVISPKLLCPIIATRMPLTPQDGLRYVLCKVT